jgi:hypothetical protein
MDAWAEMERCMTKIFKKLTLRKLAGTAIMMAGISLAALSATSAPAAARTVCDWRGCYWVPGYYGRYYDRYDWRDRRDWERRHYWRDRYYDRRYYDRRYRGPSGSLYFNF